MRRYEPEIGAVTFYCGKGGGVHVTDEHDVAAHRHCSAMNEAHRVRTGEWASFDQQCEWLEEGREASIRRWPMEKHRELTAAKALLESVGYVVKPKKARKQLGVRHAPNQEEG